MLDKGAIYWAAAFGAIAAAGAGGLVWRYHGPLLQGSAPAQLLAPGSAASVNSPPAVMAAKSGADDVAAIGSPKSAQPAIPVSPPAPKPSDVSPQTDPQRPQFDIVRVEPTGEAVIAGHAAPKAKVSVTDQGQVVAEADADEAGQFVILPPDFAPGAHALGLTARVGDGAPVQSPGIVGIDVPQPAKPAPRIAAAPSTAGLGANASAKPTAAPQVAAAATTSGANPSSPVTPTPPVKAQPSVAEAAPSQPPAPVVVARTDAAAPAAVSATPRIAISGVAADEAGRLVATGAAPPGAFLRLYLNGSLLASVTAGVDGLWSLTVEHGMKGGSYAIRADEVDRSNDSVIARAEVPFNYPAHIAELVAPIKPPAGGSAPPTADQPGAPVALSEPQKPAPQASPTVASTDAAVAPAPAAASQAQTPAAPPQPANPAVASPQAAVAPAPVAPSAPVPAAHPTAQANAAPAGAAHAVVRLVSTTRVVPGDSLWAISAHLYGDGLRYTQIYAANAGQIRNPRLIYPGQIFVVPQTTPN